MSLIICPDCGRDISSLAPACIHCGRPVAARAAVPVPATIVAVDGTPACPLCGAAVHHPHARTGGAAWCERCGGKLMYGPGGVLADALPRAPEPQPLRPMVVLRDQKSVGAAVLLAFFFGPLGMLYSTTSGALLMMLASFCVALGTFGVGLLFMWPISMIWAGYAAAEHNRRLLMGLPAV